MRDYGRVLWYHFKLLGSFTHTLEVVNAIRFVLDTADRVATRVFAVGGEVDRTRFPTVVTDHCGRFVHVIIDFIAGLALNLWRKFARI